MAQIFVSHSSADSPLALRLCECLGDLGYESVFLDVSPTDGLVPGTAWRDQLFTNLDHSDAVVFVGTPSANASRWCHSELALARWLRKPMLSLLFDGVDPHELVADIQGIHVTSADLSAEQVRPGLVALGLEQADRWDASRSPFPGLRAFDESYAPVFFGRERQIDQLRQLIDPPGQARGGVVVPVLGPSGSGKSSLVRAGLVAALRPTPDWVVSEPWTPSDAPLAELSLALAHAAKRKEVAVDADECRTLLTTPGGMPDYLRRLREAASVPADARVLVVVDQAEELVTVTAESQRKEFFEALALSSTPPTPLRVVMTARTDLWDSLSALANRFAIRVAPAVLHVPPLSRADLARVVAEPAKRSHLTLEDGLLQRLVEDTESGDALPLLAYTLQRMTALATGGLLTHALYQSIGGVHGAIASRAAEVASGLRTEADVAAAILHVVGTGAENKPITRLAPVDTVPAPQREILDDLVDARLVVIRESVGHHVYAPAHEALFSAWPPLAEMISHRGENLRLRGRLERRAADWRDAGGGTSGLLSGAELDQATAWNSGNPDLRTPDVTAYVAASTRHARRNRLVRVGVVAVVGVLALALVVVVLVNLSRDRAAARVARARDLREIAQDELVNDPVAAAIALVVSLDLDPGNVATERLARGLLRSPARDAVGSTDPSGLYVLGVGDHVALTPNKEGEVDIRDISNGKVVGSLPRTYGVAIGLDDEVAAAIGVGPDFQLKLYDLRATTPREIGTLGQSDGVDFSPSGARLVSTDGQLITLYDASDTSNLQTLATHSIVGLEPPHDIEVLDSGDVLILNKAARLYRWRALASGDTTSFQVAVPKRFRGIPASLSVSRSGNLAMVSFPDYGGRGIPLYDLGTERLLHRFAARSETSSAALSPQGNLVVTFDSSGDGVAWIAATGMPLGPEFEAGGQVGRADFAGNGLLVTDGFDGAVRVWDVTAWRSVPDGPLRDALCSEFGPRMDEDSWRLAVRDEPYENPCS